MDTDGLLYDRFYEVTLDTPIAEVAAKHGDHQFPLVVDARNASAAKINQWIANFERVIGLSDDMIAIVGNEDVNAIVLPDDANWDYLDTMDSQRSATAIYRNMLRTTFDDLNAGDRGLSKEKDPSFRPVTEFMSPSQRIEWERRIEQLEGRSKERY